MSIEQAKARFAKYRELVKAQMKLEHNHAKQNTTAMIKVFLKPFHADFVDAATKLELSIRTKKNSDYEYTVKGGEVRVREDLKEAHEALLKSDIVDLMYRIHSVACTKHEITLQQAVGSIIGNFSDIELITRRLLACNLVLEYCPHLIINITKGGEYGYVASLIRLDKEEADLLDQHSVALPSIVPLRKVRNNADIGYRTFKKSAIMGGKHHDKDICLNHLNKRNAVPFKINKEVAGRILAGKLGQFDPKPKFNKRLGRVENDAEVQERKDAWLDRQKHMKDKIRTLADHVFYFSHRRDNRGRTYCEGYHFSYQSTDDQKAIINLAVEEYVAPDF